MCKRLVPSNFTNYSDYLLNNPHVYIVLICMSRNLMGAYRAMAESSLECFLRISKTHLHHCRSCSSSQQQYDFEVTARIQILRASSFRWRGIWESCPVKHLLMSWAEILGCLLSITVAWCNAALWLFLLEILREDMIDRSWSHDCILHFR